MIQSDVYVQGHQTAGARMAGGAMACRVVVFISPHPSEHVSLRRIFRDSPWELQDAYTILGGLGLLCRNHIETPVVICERSLPDGDWKCILAELDHMLDRPSLIVSSRLADDRLWAEVLNAGAFDLLIASPYVDEEVLRVTQSGWLASSRARERRNVPHEDIGISRSLEDTGVKHAIASSGL